MAPCFSCASIPHQLFPAAGLSFGLFQRDVSHDFETLTFGRINAARPQESKRCRIVQIGPASVDELPDELHFGARC